VMDWRRARALTSHPRPLHFMCSFLVTVESKPCFAGVLFPWAC
jgi:hypothetical protein